MLKLMKQAKAALSLLSADEIQNQAAKPLHIGLVADGSSAYAEMEEFLVPETMPREQWRARIKQVHRANDVDVGAGKSVKGPLLTIDAKTEMFTSSDKIVVDSANNSPLRKREGREGFKIPQMQADAVARS